MQNSPAPKLELDKALQSINAMENATSLDDFEEAWKGFLFRLERCFNKAMAHFKKSPKWDAWWGPYKKSRTTDELLAYLINARGAEEHSVEEIVGRDPGGVGISGVNGKPLRIQGGKIHGDGNFEIRSPDGFKIEFIPAKMTLLPVRNRGRDYPVPKTHLGADIDSNNVCSVAKLAHEFYSDFLSKAEQYFVK
ncbi:MAG: hypothetical protein ACRESJ_05485 [Pseudomonas sp.]|uniref:hypothetical protein n=1 Tax=Pseudomonas sp. TaxID=306 RepID=UPI003D6EAB8D